DLPCRLDAFWFGIAQERRHRNFRQRSHRLQKVTATASSDVDDPHRQTFAMHALDYGPQQRLEIFLPLPNAAPTGTVQIISVDDAAERRLPARSVFVDVIER